ncbi:MAG: response regulator [Bacteroidetes bacterium]|nr:response regulator [Bacteroidota bacterium]
MITALIIDDEESAINVLKLLLEKYVPEIEKIFIAIGAEEGIHAIHECKPQLVFLDVEMPLMNGFQLVEKFPEHSFEIIFITAYDQYAIRAIKYSALDYLLKPIDTDELKSAVQRFLQKSKTNFRSDKKIYENLSYNLNLPESSSQYRLTLATTEGTFFYYCNEIFRCEAVGNYTRFYLKDKKPLLTSHTLKEYDELLYGQNFLRVHRAHLVNADFISSFSKEHEIKMKDGSIVPVSRRKWDYIKQKLSSN